MGYYSNLAVELLEAEINERYEEENAQRSTCDSITNHELAVQQQELLHMIFREVNTGSNNQQLTWFQETQLTSPQVYKKSKRSRN